ncbi:MAG: PhzF family phenazine biosynthesis protein [Alphaproteobacteria bacterium]
MRRRFITSDVFTDRAFGGNPLAVLPDATGLSTDQMQRLAREFNLSETAFVLPAESPGHDRKVRIFVPTKEIPFAGHPTIGTAITLAHLGAFDLAGERVSITFEMAAGLVPVTIHVNDGKPAAATLTAPRRPEIAEAPTVEQMAALLSLGKAQIMRTGAASAGNPFLMVQVEDRAALRQARIDMAVLDRIGDGLYAQEPFVFTDDAPSGADFRARMFAPLSGIPEDPATGSAVAAFGGWLGHHDALADGTIRKVIAQGLEMGRPSRLEVEVDKQGGAVIAVRVTGSAVLISEGEIEVPAPMAQG